jgi:hypothetical protein
MRSSSRPGTTHCSSRRPLSRRGATVSPTRIAQKEPFDILYFTPALTVIANAGDGSTSVTPELLYTGFKDVELRLRGVFLNGGAGTEFGERQIASRIEFRARLYF